jgi:hypothetical protein
MKSYKQFITEKHTSILYRYTGLMSGHRIVQNMQMPAVDALESINDVEQRLMPSPQHKYFASCSRSAFSSYYREDVIYQFFYPLLFELDGRVLSRKYKILPVDFVHAAKELGPADWKDVEAPVNNYEFDEEEDRIWSREPEIDMKGAIRAVYVHSHNAEGLTVYEDHEAHEAWRVLINSCKQHSIPLYHVPTDNTPLRARLKKGERLV